MRSLIQNGRVFFQKSFYPLDILIDDEKITAIEKKISKKADRIYDAEGKFVIPGFIDLHTHGAAGIDINHAEAKDYEKVSKFFASQGTTSWLCSVLTDTKKQTIWCIKEALKFQKENKNSANLLGIHLEGPFLASEYKGAMPEELLKKGDLELVKEYQKAAEGNIRYITVSPEVEGVPEMIKALREMGIVTAIGHSGADYETAWKCIQEGARAGTHTFNVMKLMHQHFPAISGAVLESDIYCEMICDGRHLHPGVVRLLIKTKGLDRVVAVTDSIMAAGMPDGKYQLGINEVIVENQDAKLLDGTRAGSTLTMYQAFLNLREFTKRPLEEIIPILTENPAKLINAYDNIGSIDIGKQADIVILNENLAWADTFVKGEKIIL